jgi:hypothetical protein
MKKIKSIKQLRAQKEQMKNRREELEYRMQRQWKELKQDLKPSSIIRDTIGAILKKKAEAGFIGGGLLKSAFTYGVSLLAGKLADKARAKYSTELKKLY